MLMMTLTIVLPVGRTISALLVRPAALSVEQPATCRMGVAALIVLNLNFNCGGVV